MAANLRRSLYIFRVPFCITSAQNSRPKFYRNEQNCTKIFCRSAGHSHWQNIKFKKMHADFARSKLFGRLALEMITAVREGGADPKLNPRLERVIERAKVARMPKDKVERAIKSGSGTSDDSYSQVLFEARGPGACGLLIDVLTSNRVRTKQDIRTILTKNGASMKDGGSVLFQFENKGVVTIEDYLFKEEKEGSYPNEEVIGQVEELAIEIGAEDIFFTKSEDEKNILKFICDIKDLKQVSDQLSCKTSHKVISSGLEYVPNTMVRLEDQPLKQADRIIDLINNHKDVIRVFDNIENYPSSTCKFVS